MPTEEFCNEDKEFICSSEATCPYCGHKDQDSWEIQEVEEDTESTCGNCDKTYNVRKEIYVSFVSWKK